MTHKVRFSKIRNDHERLRTNTAEGTTFQLPTVGKSFVLVGEALAPELKEIGFRHVNTSPVVNVDQISESSFEFDTESGSRYRVDILTDEESETSSEGELENTQ